MSAFEFNPDELEEEFSEKDGQWNGKDAVIYLIDVSPKMLQKQDEESAFIKSLKCIHSSLSRSIIGSDQNYYSVAFFNTAKSKNSLDFENIFVLQDLDRPGAERMLELEQLLEEPSLVTTKFGGSASATLHEVLWVCRSILIGSKIQLTSKSVILFTCDDSPVDAADDLKRRQSMKGARDLKDAGVHLEVIPLAASFDSSKFYKDLLTLGMDSDSSSLSVLENPSERLEELMDRVRRLEHKQRSCGRLSFYMAPGVEMGLKVFTFIRKIYKTSTKLYKVTNEEVFSQRREFLENGELLIASDLAKYQEIGGRKITFSADEVKSIPSIYDTGMELLGFKPISAFKPYHYVKPAHFIYCDENLVKGSTQMFACLLERCLARKMCPVVRVVAREGSAVSWAYLLPQGEALDESGVQEKSPGFFVCYLPFADDFRRIEISNRTRANSDQVSAAKAMMKKLHFKYNPASFDNPDIQTHWRNVEALALNRHYLEPVPDYTVPNYKQMDSKAGSLINAFKSLVLPASYDPEQAMKKRPAPASSSKPDIKKAKFDPASLSIEEMAKQKKVDKLTMDRMKLWLQDQGVKVSGKKKAQLVQDIYDFLGIEI